MVDKPLLKVKDLVIHYETGDGVAKALDGVNIHIGVRKAFGLVGEIGAGKATPAKGIMRLIPDLPGKILGGKVVLERQDLLKLLTNGMEAIHGRDIPMIFQDPMTSPNPVLTIGGQIMEVIKNHNTSLPRQEARKRTGNMLERVGIPAECFGEYPHQSSGGMKQGVVIAIALTCNPRLLIVDEFTTALDVTIQAQVLEMTYKLKSENNTSMILITHGLGVVAQNHDYVATIYVGEAVEYGTLREIYKDTRHPYTGGLFGPTPSLISDVKRLWAADGMMPDPTKLPEGCVFCERYKYAAPECSKDHPGTVIIDGVHQVRCIRYH